MPETQRKITLAAIPEVSEIDDVGDNGLFLRARNQEPIVAIVGAVLRENNIDVEEIHVEHGHLDDVFRAVTQGS